MAIIGYARVSTVGQSLDVQIDKLNKFGCEKIYREKQSGTTAQRTELKNCLDYVRDGDVLVITKLDRLARSTLHLHSIINDLNNKSVGFKVLDQSIDTTTKEGRLMFAILASIAEFETELRKERQMEGIIKAKENGVQFGRKSKLNQNEVFQMIIDKVKGSTVSNLIKKYGLSKASVYRLLSEEVESPSNIITFGYFLNGKQKNYDVEVNEQVENKLALIELGYKEAISDLEAHGIFNANLDFLDILPIFK